MNKVSVASDGESFAFEWDAVWQFWSGDPVFSGGGQRTEVNDFLRYQNPLEPTTVLTAGTTSFPLAIIYGQAIEPGTFRVVLNGVQVGGFNPIPGASETVAVPVSKGRNVLLVSVDGATSRGKTASDRDRLTIIVP